MEDESDINLHWFFSLYYVNRRWSWSNALYTLTGKRKFYVTRRALNHLEGREKEKERKVPVYALVIVSFTHPAFTSLLWNEMEHFF